MENRLLEILEHKKKEVEERKSKISLNGLLEIIEEKGIRKNHAFLGALQKESGIPKIIAEIKKASPSKGPIRTGLDVSNWAFGYEQGGASAISVLTDERFFMGSLRDLEKVKGAVKIPVLRKDFIIDPYQIYESIVWGADSILLIANILSLGELREFLALCEEEGMDALVEVHDEEDMEKAVSSGAKIIGINNRNLKTFEVSLETTFRLSAFLDPSKHIGVSESGISSYDDIQAIQRRGINCFLIGESLMRSENPSLKIRELMGSA